jgi:transcriptional regulator with XRE-family HTH domain
MSALVEIARRRTELQRLRDLAGISGRQMAACVGVSQPVMSRFDRGGPLLRMAAIRRWLDVCEADDETRARVLDLAEKAHGETKRWSELLADEAHLQGKEADYDRAATEIQIFQPTVLPGLVQTASYAQAVLQLGRTDVPAAVAARLKRQQLLDEPGRLFQFVIAERLLRWEPAPGALAGQPERLLALVERDAVEVAVLPDAAQPGVLVWHNFVIRRSSRGQPWVAAELLHGAQEIRAPESVLIYEQTWAKLLAAAARGDEARKLIRAGIRSLS